MGPRRSSRNTSTPKKSASDHSKRDTTSKKSNMQTDLSSNASNKKDPLKSPDHKKNRSSENTAHKSPLPFPPSNQLSGKEASEQNTVGINSIPKLVRFDLHICASGQEFCRAAWCKPIGHKCVVCKFPVHSFCYGQQGESIPTMCARCVSPVGVMAGVIAPVGKPEGFTEFYSSFLANEIDDIGALHHTTATNIFTPSGLKATSAPFTPERLRNAQAKKLDSSFAGNNQIDDTNQDVSTDNPIVVDDDMHIDVDKSQTDDSPSKQDQNEAVTGSDMIQDEPSDTVQNDSISNTTVEQKSFDVLAHSSSSKSVFSGNSDNTARVANTDRISVRVFVCQMVPKFDKDDNFHAIFASCFNKFMSGVIKLEPLARLIKWKADSPEIEIDALTAITQVKSEYKQYLFCSFRGEAPGKKYLRVQLSIPSECDFVDILSRLQDSGNWWEGWNSFARQIGSDATEPITIGWFMRSSIVHIGSRDLQNALRHIVNDSSLGLEFQKISQKPRSVVTNYRKRAIQFKSTQKVSAVSAVHVEVQEGRHRATLNRLEKIYNGKDCPLGINFHFVRHIDMPKMQTRSGRGGHAKCVSHQHAFELMVEHTSSEIHNIDGIVSTEDGDMSLRQALMALRVKTIKNCIGDKLFLSISRESATSNTFYFEYHIVAEAEATELVNYLPAFIKEVFTVNPKDFCDYGTCKDVEYMKWDEKQRLGIDPEMEKFELFVDGLPDVIREDGEDGGYNGLDALGQAMYKRAAGECDETLMSDTSRHKDALGQVKNISGVQKRHTGVEIDLDGASIRSALSHSTSTSKVVAAKEELTAEFTIIIDGLKDARDKEKADTDKMLDSMRAELANTRLVLEQQSALLASVALAHSVPVIPVPELPPKVNETQPSSPGEHPECGTDQSTSPPVAPSDPVEESDLTTTPTTTTTTPPTVPAPVSDNARDEPGSGSDGAVAP